MKLRVILTMLFGACLCAVGNEVLEDFETIDGWDKFSQQTPQYGLAPDAVEGKGAIKLTSPGMIIKKYKPDHGKRRHWDEKYDGLAFWVKGDGSDNWGSIAIGGVGSYRYYFPVKNAAWSRIIVPWSEFTPEDHVTQKFNSTGALPPSGISYLVVGDNWTITHRNQKIKPFSYCIDNVELVENLRESKPADTSQFQPLPIEEVIKKLKNNEAATIFCMGDSITAGTCLKKPDEGRYSALLQKKLREHFKNENITVQSRAVGGARANHCVAWVERDFSDKTPDMITYMIGYNNKSGGHPPEIFKKLLNNYIDRVMEKSKGKTAILLIPTIPGGNYRFNMQDDYAEAVRQVAQERGLPVCDVAAKFKKLGRDGISAYMEGAAHPNEKGHQIFADTLFEYLVEKSK